VTVPEEFGFRIITEHKDRLTIYQSHCGLLLSASALTIVHPARIAITIIANYCGENRVVGATFLSRPVGAEPVLSLPKEMPLPQGLGPSTPALPFRRPPATLPP